MCELLQTCLGKIRLSSDRSVHTVFLPDNTGSMCIGETGSETSFRPVQRNKKQKNRYSLHLIKGEKFMARTDSFWPVHDAHIEVVL